jgi:hypothetical protein
MLYPFMIGAGVTGFMLAFAHFFPWRRELDRIQAYSIGLGSIIVGMWVITYFRPITIYDLLGVSIVGGAVTYVAYLYDKATERDKELEERLNRHVGQSNSKD